MTSATLPLPADRMLAPEPYTIGGVTPRMAARPADRAELCELLRATARDGGTIVPWGGGTSLRAAAPPGRYDLAIDLRGLDRVIEYEPEDLTLTAECGVTIAALRGRLAARGQELPLECAQAAGATFGGVLAANASGPRRLRFGAPVDRILGARFALADGTLAHTGGKVVKNVAGYGIHRLLCGAGGALGMFVDASLKLLPAPAARAARIYELTRAQLVDRALWAPFPRLEPAVFTVVGAATASGTGSAAAGASLPGATGRRPFWAVLGFEDDAPRVAELCGITAAALGEPVAELRDAEAEGLWQRLADLADSAPMRLTFTSAHNTPAALVTLPDAGAGTQAGGFVFHAACGRLHEFPAAALGPDAIAARAAAGFALIEARGAVATPAIPSVSGVRELRRRIRTALDPGSRMALGAAWEGR